MSVVHNCCIIFCFDMMVTGIGLMEIITEPDFSSSGEAVAFVKELQLMLQTLGTCDGRMEGCVIFC